MSRITQEKQSKKRNESVESNPFQDRQSSYSAQRSQNYQSQSPAKQKYNDQQQDGEASFYEQNKKRQQTSQLGSILNWDQSERINIRNIASQYKQKQQKGSAFHTPQPELNNARKTCSYLGIGEKDQYQTPAKQRQSRNTPELKQSSNYQQINDTLTSLQLEKQKLEGEYSKLRFSQISTNKDQKVRKQHLELEIDHTNTRINSLKKCIRELKYK